MVTQPGTNNNNPYKPRSPREYGGKVCQNCVIDENKVKHFTYYVTEAKGPWPYGPNVSISLHPDLTPNCNDGDLHIANWHTHPSKLLYPSDRLKRSENLNETTYYWGGADSFSSADRGAVDYSSKPLYVTRRNSSSAYPSQIVTSILVVGTNTGRQVDKTDIGSE